MTDAEKLRDLVANLDKIRVAPHEADAFHARIADAMGVWGKG